MICNDVSRGTFVSLPMFLSEWKIRLDLFPINSRKRLSVPSSIRIKPNERLYLFARKDYLYTSNNPDISYIMIEEL